MTADAAGVVGEIRRRTPRARCRECGDDAVAALCCNCAAFLCSRHDRVADLEEARRVASSLLRRGIRSRSGGPDALDRVPAPAETPAGSNADQPRREEDNSVPADARTEAPAEAKSVQRRHFCSDCVPVGHAYDVHVFGSLAGTLLGLAITSVSGAVGTVMIIASAGWLGVRVGTGLVRRRRRGRLYRGLLFLPPRIRKVELTETVVGRCKLDAERRETLVVDDVRGTIDVGLRWAGSHATRAARHREHVRPDRRNGLRAEAGYLVLRGAGQLDLAHPAGCEVTHAARLTLRPWVADHEVLSHPDGRGDARWDFTLNYQPEQPASGWRLPVWVTPSFTPDSERRSLDLRVQWRTADPITDPDGGPTLTAKELTRVVLEVPGVWGTVQQATLDGVEQTLVGHAPDGSTRIEWKKPVITQASRGSRDLSVSFSRSVDPSATVKGEVEIAFVEAVSGITALQMHAPGGGRRQDGVRPKIKTKMLVRFELSLAGIRHQESRTVPDAAVDQATESRTFPGARPDQHLIVGIVRQLADQRHLVKSVVEHPARPGRGVGLQYRVWDITGRRYRAVHPIDFRITVTGDEAEAGASSPSVTSIRLIVRGVHASPEMEDEIVKAYEEIWARIVTAVGAAEAGADGNLPRLQSEPLAAIGAHAAHLQGTLLSIESLVDEAKRDGRISTDLAEQMQDAVELGRSGGA